MNQPQTPEIAVSKHRVLVTSIPKAGTYLMAEILKDLGLKTTGMHLLQDFYTDYSQATLEEARNSPESLKRPVPLENSLENVAPGSFAVSHIACEERMTELTRDFKRIFLYRELRTCLVSHQRFFFKTKRGDPNHNNWITVASPKKRMLGFLRELGSYIVSHNYQSMLGWLKHPGTLSIRYEDLAAGNEQSANNVDLIAWYLNLDHIDSQAILENALSADTLTKSPKQSRVVDYWSDEAEEWFIQSGGAAVNTALGFTEDESAPFRAPEAAA